MNLVLRSTLIEMKALDERTRARLAETGELLAGYAPAMEELHSRNADALMQIAISRPAHQRSFLVALEDAVRRGDAPPRQRACLQDRIRFNERRPQRYGTVLDWGSDGELTVGPVEDPAGLDARRAALGLPLLADALAAAKACARQAGERPPTDHAEREREAERWAKRVGWL